MRRKIVLGLSAAFAAIVYWQVVVTSGTKAPRASAVIRESASEPPSRAQPEPQVLANRPAPIQPAAFQVAVAPNPEPQPIQPSPAKAAAEAPSEDERRSYAAVVFEGQAFDHGWATETRRSVQAKLDAIKDNDIRVGPIDCRSTLCRFELYSEGSASLQGYMRKMIRSDVGAGMVVRGDASGPSAGAVTVYLARAGSPLPEVPLE